MATPISTTQFQVSGTKQKSKGTPSTASTALVGNQAEKQGLHDTKTNAIDARKMIIHLKIDLKWMAKAGFFNVPYNSSVNFTGLGVDHYLISIYNEWAEVGHPCCGILANCIKTAGSSYQSFSSGFPIIAWSFSACLMSLIASSWVKRHSQPSPRPRYCSPKQSAAVVANDLPKTLRATRRWIRRCTCQAQAAQITRSQLEMLRDLGIDGW